MFKGAKRNKKFEENFCSFLASLFLLLIFFFIFSDRCVFLSVVVKNTRIRRRKSVLWSRSYGSITALASKRSGREEYSSTDDDYYNS